MGRSAKKGGQRRSAVADVIPPAGREIALHTGVGPVQASFTDSADGRPSYAWANYKGFNVTAGYGSFYGMPGSEVAQERSFASAVTMDLLTSNPLIATLVENLTTYAIGTGLTLSSRPNSDALGISPEAGRDLSHQIERAWLAWGNNPVECDASGRHNVHQLAAASFKAYLLSGESLFVLDWRKGMGARTSTKVRLLDSRQLDQSITRVQDGGSILQGIQFDGAGRVVGFWIRPFVLGNANSAPQATFIQARTTWGRERVVHLFDLIAPGQVRGLTPLIAALSPAQSKGMLREYTLAAALIQTQTPVTIESDLPSGQALAALNVPESLPEPVMLHDGTAFEKSLTAKGAFYSASKINLRAGTVSHLMDGDKLKMHRSESPNSAYDAYDKSLGREAAKAAGSSAEDASGYFGDTSFSASRLAMELPWRINKRRRAAISERFYSSVFKAFLEEACETGAIQLPAGAPAFWESPDAYSECVWRGEGKPVADVLKQYQATILAVQNGLTTMTAALGENGADFEETLAQQKAEKEQYEQAGLVYPGSAKSTIVMSPDKPDDEQALS